MPERLGTDRAFVGVSLDSRLFTREWLRLALGFLLDRHESVLIVLADALLTYTRSAQRVGERTVLRVREAEVLVERRRRDTLKAIERATSQFSPTNRQRISVRLWSDFEDAQFVRLWRALQIAHASIEPFGALVDRIAISHAAGTGAANVPGAGKAGAAFILDEIAMCLRITEVGDWSAEYHPASDLPALTELYADQFASHGLTVETIVGAPRRRRRFHILNHDDLAARRAEISVSPEAAGI